MLPSLQLLFDELERQKANMIDHVSQVNDERFYKKPNPNKWSVAQILTHIMIAERMSLRYMKKKSLGIDKLPDSGLFEQIKYSVLKLSQRLPLRYKAPGVVVENTPHALSLEELQVQWKESRAELYNFLSSIEKKNIRKKIYKHAFAGRLDVRQALGFLDEHMKHHAPQIERLIK